MPRPVSPWAWRRALRDLGPDDRSLLLTLFVVGTWMNRDGSCFPNQATIARAARVSERTVRRQMREAESLGWIGREFMHRGGHASRNHLYRASVPDHVPLDKRDEDLYDVRESQDGQIGPLERAAIQASAPSQRPAIIVAAPTERAATQMAAPNVCAPRETSTSGQTAPGRAANSGERPAIQSNDRTSGWPANSSLLTLHLNSHKSEARSEPAAERVINTRKRKDPEPESIEDRERKAIAMLIGLPNATYQQLKIYGFSRTQIAEFRKRIGLDAGRHDRRSMAAEKTATGAG